MQWEYQIFIMSGKQRLSLCQVFPFPEDISILAVHAALYLPQVIWRGFRWDRKPFSPDCALSALLHFYKGWKLIHLQKQSSRDLFYTRALYTFQYLGQYIDMQRPVPNSLSPILSCQVSPPLKQELWITRELSSFI